MYRTIKIKYKMMIKKSIISIIVMFITISGFTQTKKDSDFIKDELGVDKSVIIHRFVKPSKENETAFEKIYSEYRIEYQAIAKERFSILKEYSGNWKGMSNEEADKWTASAFELNKKRNVLIKTYYEKIKIATNSKLATQFLQVEIYANSVVRNAIFKDMPFVADESKKVKK